MQTKTFTWCTTSSKFLYNLFNVVAREASGEQHNVLDALKDSDAVSAKDKDVEDAGAKGLASGNASENKGATNTRAKRCLA